MLDFHRNRAYNGSVDTMTCEKCGASHACELIATQHRTVTLCSACKAIAVNRIARRALYFSACSHAFAPWTMLRRSSRKRGAWWHRECLRCRVIQEEFSQHKPTEDEDLSWAN
jgi:hypothetical protein